MTEGLDLHLGVDKAAGFVGRALETALREAIRSGRLHPGARLPGSRSLAADLGISRGTVVQAYTQLIAEGWLTGTTGSGTRGTSCTTAGFRTITSALRRTKAGDTVVVCPGSYGRRDGNVHDGPVCPLCNFHAPIHHGMLRILKIEYIRPYQMVNTIDNALQDSKNRSSFLGNPCLALIIKRPIETVRSRYKSTVCLLSVPCSAAA